HLAAAIAALRHLGVRGDGGLLAWHGRWLPGVVLLMHLSAVVISFNPPAVLHRCLEALEPQIRPGESELLVVGRWPEAEWATLQSRFPVATFLPAPAEENIPHMRLRGLEHSQGQLVALLEDD